MAHDKSDKCIKCDKLVYQSMWSVHSVAIHCILSAVDWVKKDYLSYQQKTFLYTCQFCTDYKCTNCEKHVYYGQKGILCSDCDLLV